MHKHYRSIIKVVYMTFSKCQNVSYYSQKKIDIGPSFPWCGSWKNGCLSFSESVYWVHKISLNLFNNHTSLILQFTYLNDLDAAINSSLEEIIDPKQLKFQSVSYTTSSYDWNVIWIGMIGIWYGNKWPRYSYFVFHKEKSHTSMEWHEG